MFSRRYVEKLFENTKNELRQFRIRRKKRQAGPAPKLRLRKELRMMSDEEIKLFFDAVNSAKQNTVSHVTTNYTEHCLGAPPSSLEAYSHQNTSLTLHLPGHVLFVLFLHTHYGLL